MLRIPIFRRALPIRLLPATATTILSNSTTSGGSARACRRSLISPGPSAAPMPPTSSTKRLSFIVPHDSRVWLLCSARSRTEQIRWSAQRGPVAEPRGLYEPARRDHHRPVGSLALGRRPDAVLWPRFSPTGLLPVQRFPHLRKHALGVPIRVFQPHQPSQLLASRI